METKSQSVSFDPRTKLLLLITVSGILVQGKMEGMLIGVNLCMLAVPLLFFWVDKRYKKTIKYGLIFLTGVIHELGILPRLTGQSAVLAAAVISLMIKIMPGLALGMHIVMATEPAELLCALQKMHMPNVIIWTLCLVFRFFPTVKEELGYTLDAIYIRMGGIKQLILRPVTALEFVFVPLIMSVVSIGNELLMAVLTKGFSMNGERTNVCVQKLRVQDYVAFSLAGVAWVIKFLT